MKAKLLILARVLVYILFSLMEEIWKQKSQW
jgi:hypothetical protein